MSSKKTSGPEDPFASIPPRESFDAFPAMSAFPEQAIAFLTGKAAKPPEEDAASPAGAPDQDATTAEAPLAAAAETAGSPAPLVEPAPPSQTKTALARTAVKTAPAKEPARLLTKPVKKPVSKPLSQSESQTDSPPVNQPQHRLASQSASLEASQKTNQSQDLSSSRGAASEARQPVSQSESQPLNQTGSLLLPSARLIDKLNANQRRVLDLLLANKPYIIRFRDIANVLDMREASVRTILRRLATLSFLTFKRARDGNIQGVRVTFNAQMTEQYRQERDGDPSCGLSFSQSPSQSRQRSEVHGPDHDPSRTQSQPVSRPDTKPPLQIDRKENLSISCFEDWDDTFLELMWPRVAAAGFGMDQIRQAVAARDKLGKTLDRELVTVSLDRADWELETTGRIVDLASNEKVRSVPAYIFTALARWGALRPHPEYVSREEREADAAREELQRRKKAADAAENARFEKYVAGLAPEALEEAMRGFPGGSRDAWLKNYWRKHVRDAEDGLSSPS